MSRRRRSSALGRVAAGGLLALPAYDAAIAAAAWNVPKPAPRGPRSHRFRVVVPAHDEAAVVPRLLDDLAAQDYPRELVGVWVIADRCTDETATLARAAGARVAERWSGASGKAAALRWYLEEQPLHEDEALVVLDADNRVPPHLLGRFSDELHAGRAVLQAYLDVTNPTASSASTAAALSYWASNRTVQMARSNLGLSADLGGTGMCLSAAALRAVGGFGDSLTEDQELTAKLVLAGMQVAWLHDVRVLDEKPTDVGVAVRQRGRWVSGKSQVRRRYLAPLLRAGLRGDLAAADLALRLVHPGRSFIALVCGVLASLSALRPVAALPGWRLWTAATVVQVGLPPVFMVRDRVPLRYVLRYPYLTILAALWIPVRVASRLTGRSWYHTPHTGSST